MVFNDSTTEDAICQEIDRICATDTTTYTLKAKTARVNQALDRFFYLALLGDGSWQYDDPNQTDLPIATTNVVSGQMDYTFASELLVVTKVLVQNQAGSWMELQQVDQSEKNNTIYGQPSTTGIPNKYDILGNSIVLDPIPSYNATSGLKVMFKRNASKFVSTDTTKVAGIPSLFHSYLARYASLQWAIEKELRTASSLAVMVERDEAAIADFLSNRNPAKNTRIGMVFRSSR